MLPIDELRINYFEQLLQEFNSPRYESVFHRTSGWKLRDAFFSAKQLLRKILLRSSLEDEDKPSGHILWIRQVVVGFTFGCEIRNPTGSVSPVFE